MTGMTRYYLSRALISAVFGGFFVLTGSPWWKAALAGIIPFALCLWAPRSGQYAVHPERGITALQHDERTRTIIDKAARNAFIATMMAVGGLVVYFGSIAPADVPVHILNFVLVLGATVYFAVGFWLRRA